MDAPPSTSNCKNASEELELTDVVNPSPFDGALDRVYFEGGVLPEPVISQLRTELEQLNQETKRQVHEIIHQLKEEKRELKSKLEELTRMHKNELQKLKEENGVLQNKLYDSYLDRMTLRDEMTATERKTHETIQQLTAKNQQLKSDLEKNSTKARSYAQKGRARRLKTST